MRATTRGRQGRQRAGKVEKPALNKTPANIGRNECKKGSGQAGQVNLYILRRRTPAPTKSARGYMYIISKLPALPALLARAAKNPSKFALFKSPLACPEQKLPALKGI